MIRTWADIGLCFAIVLGMVFCLQGCAPQTPEEVAEAAKAEIRSREDVIACHFPKGTKVIEFLDNGCYVLEIPIEKEPRKFFAKSFYTDNRYLCWTVTKLE